MKPTEINIDNVISLTHALFIETIGIIPLNNPILFEQAC